VLGELLVAQQVLDERGQLLVGIDGHLLLLGFGGARSSLGVSQGCAGWPHPGIGETPVTMGDR
ncbi:hypothetical protein ALI22I_28645, partial [Saccharothrix sp. ALI-22-I]